MFARHAEKQLSQSKRANTPSQRSMARFSSAAAIKNALNRLSPEDAWGDQASVSRMFDDGIRSLKHVANMRSQLLESYGIPLRQVGDLQHEARQAVPKGERSVASAVWFHASAVINDFSRTPYIRVCGSAVFSLEYCCAVVQQSACSGLACSIVVLDGMHRMVQGMPKPRQVSVTSCR